MVKKQTTSDKTASVRIVGVIKTFTVFTLLETVIGISLYFWIKSCICRVPDSFLISTSSDTLQTRAPVLQLQQLHAHAF
jgi:hypothetical protein